MFFPFRSKIEEDISPFLFSIPSFRISMPSFYLYKCIILEGYSIFSTSMIHLWGLVGDAFAIK